VRSSRPRASHALRDERPGTGGSAARKLLFQITNTGAREDAAKSAGVRSRQFFVGDGQRTASSWRSRRPEAPPGHNAGARESAFDCGRSQSATSLPMWVSSSGRRTFRSDSGGRRPVSAAACERFCMRSRSGAYTASVDAFIGSVLVDELWCAVVGGIEERNLECDEAHRAPLHARCLRVVDFRRRIGRSARCARTIEPNYRVLDVKLHLHEVRRCCVTDRSSRK
jgi:hypothetical protein